MMENENGVCFILSGVGSTWAGMCRDLMNVPIFREAIDNIDTLLEGITGWSIARVFRSSDPRVVDDSFTRHICIFACQVGLASVWKFFGINPKVVLGISVGEVAAAHIAGSLSLEAASKVIYERSRVAAKAVGGCTCFIRNISKDDIETACSQTNNRASIAAEISPLDYSIAGDTDAIEKVKQLLKKQTNLESVYVKEVDAKYAYHSHYLERSSVELADLLEELSGRNQKPICILPLQELKPRTEISRPGNIGKLTFVNR